MAATSLCDHVFLDTEECYKPEVAKWQQKYRVECGTPRMVVTEELSAQCGKCGWTWKDSMGGVCNSKDVRQSH